MFTLQGQTALVTGSGRGLGLAIIRRLAELGADVAVHDITHEAPQQYGEAESLSQVAQDLRQFGGRVVVAVADLTDSAATDAMAQQVEQELGPLTILVNCAGGDIGVSGGKPVPNDALNIPLADMRLMLDRNLLSTMLVCRAVCPGMRQRGSGAVLNIASVAGQVGLTDGVIYAVAKAGVIEWTRCLAADLRPHGVRVNALSPGPTMTARFLVSRPIDPHMRDTAIPLERYGTPEEVADTAAFLVSDAARFISGQVLRVDGGMQLFAG